MELLNNWLGAFIGALQQNAISYPMQASMARVQQVPSGHLPRTKDFTRRVPKPIVIMAHVNGQPVHALVDCGSLGDFISSALADQLCVSKIELEKLLSVQLAVQGLRTKVNFGCKNNFQYASIVEERYFDIVNVDGYDLILGTPFLFQHQVSLAFNDTRIVIGNNMALSINGTEVAILSSRAVNLSESALDQVRAELTRYTQPLCKKASDTTLPPLQKTNHRIPIIDPSKCLLV
jgi:hypothetical protein